MSGRPFWWLAAVVAIGAGAAGVYRWKSEAARAEARPAAAPPERTALVAQARLEPMGGVLHVGAPMDCVLSRVLVKEGQFVKAGEPIAYLNTYEIRKSEREASSLRIQRAGLGALGVQAQQSQIKTIEIENADAERERERRQKLLTNGAIAERDVELADTRLARTESEGDRARTVLSQLEKNTTLEMREAQRGLAVADALLEHAIIRAPSDGEVLRMIARAGERPGIQGILVLGNTHQMTALAEVHANDIRSVAVGQRAQFISPALAAPVPGRIDRIGTMIYRNNVFGEDPTAPENLRVFEVRVVLDSSEVPARYTNLEGQVKIELAPAPPAPSAQPTSSTAARPEAPGAPQADRQ